MDKILCACERFFSDRFSLVLLDLIDHFFTLAKLEAGDLSIPETPVFVQGDRAALQRVLYDLLSNVVRYGSDGRYLGSFCARIRAVYI